MNSLFSKSAVALINLAALAVCCSALSAQAETGNLPDAGTTATLPAQNIDRFSAPAAASAVTAGAETTATNKIIDSISSIELNAGVQPEPEAAEQAAAPPAADLQESAAAPEQSEAAKSEVATAENQQNTSIAAETENAAQTATVADNSVKAQPTVETAEKVDLAAPIVAGENSELTANQEKEVETATAIVADNSVKAQPTVETAEKVDLAAPTVAGENSELTAANEEKEVKTAGELLQTPASTSASALTNEPNAAEKGETASATSDTEVAQVDVRPGRSTRSGPSYIGIGGNLGFGGDSALGDSSFAIISKIGLTTNFSVRPTVLFRDELTLLVPLTYDFVSQDAVEVSEDFVITAAPYLGAGLTLTTGDDSVLGFLISGGVDVPLSSNFTATAGLNVGFLDGAEVGLLIGVGYTFPNIAR